MELRDDTACDATDLRRVRAAGEVTVNHACRSRRLAM
jgi:hypothetical protein